MTYWVKFKDKNPTSWTINDFDEFLIHLIGMLKREPELIVEWIIID